MSAKTAAERKSDQRVRDRKNGMREVSVKIHKDWVTELRSVEGKMQHEKTTRPASGDGD